MDSTPDADGLAQAVLVEPHSSARRSILARKQSEYDAEGNRTKKCVDGTLEQTVYVYDHRNRLISVLVADSSGQLSPIIGYQYDVFDRRVSKGIDEDFDWFVDQYEKYIWDGDDIVLDFLDSDGDGNDPYELATRYLHGPAVDQILAQEDADTNAVLWMLADNLNTVRDTVDNNGNIAEHYTYDAFGNVTGVYDTVGNQLSTDINRHVKTSHASDSLMPVRRSSKWAKRHKCRWRRRS